MVFNRTWIAAALAHISLCAFGSAAMALSVPFTENFNTSNEAWKNSNSKLTDDAVWISAGGPDGAGDAYIRSTFTTPDVDPPSSSQVLFRARNTVNSSNGFFFGNWITGQYPTVDFWFRHDADTALNIGMRLPTAAGFPAMLGRFPTPVDPDTWTHLTMAINPTNPELLDETGPTHNNFNAVFQNVTSIQIFAALDTQPNATVFNFDMDQFTVTPEPSTWLTAGLGIIGLLPAIRARWRRRRQS